MSQVGRIGGGVLQDNIKLLQDNSGKEFLSIRSEAGDTSLLYFDAVNNRIGVDLENPSRDLTVKTKIQSVNSSSDIWELPVYTIQNNELEVNSGEIYLTASVEDQYSINWQEVAIQINRTAAYFTDHYLHDFIVTQASDGYLYGDFDLSNPGATEQFFGAGAPINSNDASRAQAYGQFGTTGNAERDERIETVFIPALYAARAQDPERFNNAFIKSEIDPSISLSGLTTDDIKIDNERISTYNSNANLDLIPNGTGTVEILKSMDIYGSLSNTGNIAMGGNLIFGAGPESPDKIAFNTPIASNIIPDVNDTFSIGTDTQRIGQVHTYLLNGELVDAQTAVNAGVQLEHRAGNIIYVAENGDDTNRGDHPQGPFRTLKRALEFSDASVQGPVTIHIFPGEYEEEFPLEVPSQVTVAGTDLRNTIIKPTATTRYNDAFLLNGESTVQDLAVKDFFYDSLNNTGHAFRFVSGAVVTSRSPYIQNVSVITQGSIAGVQHILENPDAVPTGSNDRFGSAVAIDGDYVVAAASGEQTGYVYIYNKNTGELLHSIAAPSANNDLFGSSVDVSGNYAIVGDYIDDSLGTNTGIAYIIDVTTGSVVHTLTEPSPGSNNYFGRDVAIDGNYAVVGAYGNGGNIGKAYIFNVTTGNVLHTLDNPTGLSDRRFAYNVAISGTNVLVGAQYESSGGYAAAGKVYMFSATTGSLTRTFSNPESGSSKQADYFGAGIAIDGNNIVIGADNSNLAADTGKLYFYNTSGTLIDSFVPEQDNQDAIGDVVSISGDNVVLGFYEADNRQGKVQIYSHSTSELLYEGLNPGNTSNQDYFANAVDIDGTILVVGSQNYDDGSINAAGRTFIIDIADTTTFGIGDAGRGAYIDGSEVAFASRNASMLFHAATFITPGVDAITLTNGVRVEWLNSFTYFANRGLYAVRGATGHLSEDGSTMMYGAEIRSIGSASVYGNIGAEADGDGCIMYLINHNFAYIGVGQDVSNDNTLVIEDNQWVEVNNGKVFIQNTDQLGKFRVGDDFFVDLQTGETSISTDGVALDGLSQIVIGTGEDQTILNDSFVQTGNIRFAGNTVFSLVNDLNIDSVSTNTNFTSDVLMDKNVDITGNFTIDGTLNTFGNQPEDTVDFNVDIDQDFYPEVDRVHSLGSSTKLWDNVYTDEFNIDDVKIFDNVITTTVSNANLDLKSNQTGYVQTEDLIWQNNSVGSYESDVVFSTTGNLIIDSTNAQGLIVPRGTNIERVETTGSLRYSNEDSVFEGWGDNRITFGGVYSTDRRTSIFTQPDETIDIRVDALKVGEINNEGFTLHGLQSDSVLVNGNVITSSESNADLELRRKGDQQVTLNGQEYFRDNIWTNSAEEGLLTIASTDRGYVKIGGTYGVVVGTTGGVITDNVNDLTIGTDTGTSLLFEADNAGRIDQAAAAPTGDGEFTTTGLKTFASSTSGVQNFFLDFDILDITNIYEVEITGIRFRGNFDKDSQFVDVTFPQPGGGTYVTRVGEFEDAGDTSTFTQSLVFNAVPQSNTLYVHTGTTKTSFESQIVLDSGSYGMNISIDVPASINTAPAGMTDNWELEISYRYITINNKFDEYDVATNNYYYIFDEDTTNLSDPDRYIVTETQIEPTFRRARLSGKIILGSDTNGSGLYAGDDIVIQYSDDGTNDTGMVTLGRIVDANEFASFGTWRDWEFSFEFVDSTAVDFNNLKFRIVQTNGGRLGENSWALTDVTLSITRRADEPAPIGGFRYDPVAKQCEVWDGTQWLPSTGIEEDPVTEEFMQELVGLYSVVLG